MNAPLVSIIIPNFNGEKYLPVCLSSLLKTSYKNFELCIIDDGSSDTSEKIIHEFQKKDKRIVYEKNSSNIGAAASRNTMARKTIGKIFVFLDNDVEVTPEWLTEILKTFEKDEKIGGCQSLLVDYEYRNKIQTAGTHLWAMTGWGLPIGKNENPSRFTEELPVIAISAALAIRKDVFDTVGGFDEEEAIVTEDLDFSWRVWLSGYRIVLSPKSIVYHWTKSVDMRKNMKHSKETIYFQLTKNSLISILKNYELKNAIKYFVTSMIISVLRGLAVMIKRKDTSAWNGTIQGFVWTLSHFNTIITKRKQVQKIRKYSDTALFKTVILRLSLKTVYNDYFQQTNLM